MTTPAGRSRRGALSVLGVAVLTAAIAGCQTTASPAPSLEGGVGGSGDIPASSGVMPGGSDDTGVASPAPSGSTAAGLDQPLALEQAFEAVVTQVGPSIVLIETSAGLGSGVVFDSSGDIVTNAHVVGTDKQFRVTTSTGNTLNANLVGSFAADDLAVIHVEGSSLQAASFGDSSQLRVGEIVLALGNPLGLQSSVTEGIVSAVGRTVDEPGGAALP